jgi:hypothetical protein
MSFDSMPIWAVLVATIGLVFLSIEIGVRLGKRRVLRSEGKLEVSGALVGATMGLLAFMLAFTFNGAAGRHDARKSLVIEEANAIDKTWLRAGFLAEPNRAEVRGLLRDYVDLRVKVAGGEADLADGLRRSDALHDRMWAVALAVGQQNAGSITAGLFIQSLSFSGGRQATVCYARHAAIVLKPRPVAREEEPATDGIGLRSDEPPWVPS